MKRVHMVISGDVIGVGFRSWARFQAKASGLTGWVKNRSDKTVEAVAEGNPEALEKFIELCKRGPDVAWVEHVDVEWSRSTGEFLDFRVVY